MLGVLEHRAYLDGTRYYETAECFLFFSARLLHKVRDSELHAKFTRLLRERVLERTGCTQGDALALAMRVIVGAGVGLRLERDLAALLPLQYEDGGWGPSWIYKYGSSGIKIGNRGLTTALALNAIAALYPPQPRPQTEPQDQEQKQVDLVEKLELDSEKEKKLTPTCRSPSILAMPLPLLRFPVTSVIHGSITAFVKGILAILFSRSGLPPPRQA